MYKIFTVACYLTKTIKYNSLEISVTYYNMCIKANMSDTELNFTSKSYKFLCLNTVDNKNNLRIFFL